MFDIRLRLFTDGGVKSRVLRTLKFDVTVADSGSPSLRFSTSTKVAGALEAPFLVGVEYSTGGAWVQPRNGLFIATTTDGDSLDATGGQAFAAEGFVPWLLRHAHVRASSAVVDGSRTYTSPGDAMKSLIDAAKATGWGPNVSYNFSATLDSAGAAWVAAEQPPAQNWLTPASQVLQSMTDLGLCEWWVEGQQLRLYKAGVSSDKTRIRLGGKGYTSAPAKADFTDVFTDVTVVVGSAQDGSYLDVANTGADARFGKLWATMTQSGVESGADALRLASNALESGRVLKRQLSYEWTVVDGMPFPWVDFQIGDLVTARTLTGWMQQRLVGYVISKDSGVTVRAVVGSRLLSQAAKVANRAQAATVGQIISGSGAGLVQTQPVSLSTPAAPTGLTATSNSATWAADLSELTRIVLQWNDVTTNVDGSGISVAGYEVFTRTAAEVSSMERFVTASEAVIEGWPSGTQRFIKVRARGHDGRVSAFSSEIAVTPNPATSIIPVAPTVPVAATNTGTFAADGSAQSVVRITWSAVALGTSGAAITVDGYELIDTTVPTAYAPINTTKELYSTVTFPAGQTRKYRIRARSVFGVWGDYSPELTVTGALPTQSTSAPTTPTLQSQLGLVIPTWDGLLASGAPPTQFQHLITQRATASGGPWTDVGVPATRAGQTATIQAATGSTVWVRFLWRDTLGRLSTASAAASITVQGVSEGDIPAAEYENWARNPFFDQLDLGWELVGGAAIAAEPFGTHPNSAAITGTGEIRQAGFPVRVGDVYRFEIAFKSATSHTPGGLRLQKSIDGGVNWTDAGSSEQTLSAAWQTAAVNYTVAAGVTHLRIRIAYAGTGTTYINGVSLVRTNERLSSAEIWANRAWLDQAQINVLEAGIIETSMLVAGFGGSLDIAANGAVTTIITQQNTMATALADQADAAQDAADAALAAADLAGTAEAAAAAATAQATAAAAAAAAAQAASDTLSTWFRVDGAGAHVGQTGNPFQANVLPGEFNITENGVRMTWWQAGQMTVPSLVTDTAAVSNHKFEKYGTGTVIRALG